MVLGDGLFDALKKNSGNVTPEPFTGALRRRHRLVGLITATLRNVQCRCARLRVDTSHQSIAGCWLNTLQVKGHLHLLPPAPGSAGDLCHVCSVPAHQSPVPETRPPPPIGVLGGHSYMC